MLRELLFRVTAQMRRQVNTFNPVNGDIGNVLNRLRQVPLVGEFLFGTIKWEYF